MKDLKRITDDLSEIERRLLSELTFGPVGEHTTITTTEVSSWADTIREMLEAIAEIEHNPRLVVCPKCRDEIEIKWSLLTKPDMDAIAKRDTFLSDENGKKLQQAFESLWGEDV